MKLSLLILLLLSGAAHAETFENISRLENDSLAIGEFLKNGGIGSEGEPCEFQALTEFREGVNWLVLNTSSAKGYSSLLALNKATNGDSLITQSDRGDLDGSIERTYSTNDGYKVVFSIDPWGGFRSIGVSGNPSMIFCSVR